MPVRPRSPFRGQAAPALLASLRSLPAVSGSPVVVSFRGPLTAHRGQLLAGRRAGAPVHAATFLRERRMVLDTALRSRPGELRRIAIHEMFHFAWVRLGNPRRGSYEEMLRGEMTRGARGELGWSAELRKSKLTPGDLARGSRRWREYVCESFCDSAAWLFGGIRRHGEFTLARVHRERRARWFREAGLADGIPI